jgi:hypothetical protein
MSRSPKNSYDLAIPSIQCLQQHRSLCVVPTLFVFVSLVHLLDPMLLGRNLPVNIMTCFWNLPLGLPPPSRECAHDHATIVYLTIDEAQCRIATRDGQKQFMNLIVLDMKSISSLRKSAPFRHRIELREV